MNSLILNSVSFLAGVGFMMYRGRVRLRELNLAREKIERLKKIIEDLEDMNNILTFESMDLEAKLDKTLTPLEKLNRL